MWIGSPLPNGLVSLFKATHLPLPKQLVWLSEARNLAWSSNASLTSDQGNTAARDNPILAGLVSAVDDDEPIACEYLRANLGTLEGRGRILDSLRQREPKQLVIWLPAPEGMGSTPPTNTQFVPNSAFLASWTVGVTEVTSAAIALMAQQFDAQIVIVQPDITSNEDAIDPEAQACVAYLNAWVNASQSRARALGVSLSVIVQPAVDA